jgi:hypothetical protein
MRTLDMLYNGNKTHGADMKTLNWLYRVLIRFRYPVTLPEEIATDLGITVSNFVTFNEFVSQLSSLSSRPLSVKRFMPRDAAEAAFKSAQRKEKFCRNSLYSYYFLEGWVEFNLHFDEHSRLRRIYLQHKYVENEEGIEILLHQDPTPFLPSKA